uniref:NADH dehydrogenase subunit 6 n=1 Tax=Panopea globosa TaxID=1237092 RepID=A0A0U1XN03_9BIVA|nr:NADH dehydrogenase subunit 6 [Panopea globosa]AIU56067.1 NADH dehydrogenase subunit 6 [Panopea globosa]
MFEMFVMVLSLLVVLGIASSSHPLVLGGMLLLLSSLCVLFVAIKMSSLIAIFLFMVFIGGLLVLFSYVVSLASNPFVFSKVDEIPVLLLGVALLSVLGVFMVFVCVYSTGVNEVLSFLVDTFQWAKLITMSNLWLKIIVFLSVLLFLSMVVVVNICSSFKGALVKFLKGSANG